MIKINKLIGLSALMLATISTGYASKNNYTCPQPSEIQSTDFTAPSIWLAPPVAHSLPGQVGAGLGGKKVKELLGIEEAEVHHKKGWVCVYSSEGGVSVNEYQMTIKNIVDSNPYLKKYLDKVNKAFNDAEPYLKNYPKDSAIGFVGYQAE